MLNSILSSVAASEMKIGEFAICMAVSLVLGILCIFLHSYKNQASKSFLITLALLPLIVQVIIAVVNGNLGTGVAVAGAFTLVRFRSAPGNAREISSIFLAMTIGLADGMAYTPFIWTGCFFFLSSWEPRSTRCCFLRELSKTLPKTRFHCTPAVSRP